MVNCGVSNACNPPIVPRKAENVKTFWFFQKQFNATNHPLMPQKCNWHVAVDG